jgi:hypothetical protein
VTLEHRSRPSAFSAAVPRSFSSPCVLPQSNCAAGPVFSSHLLSVSVQIRTDAVFHNAFVLNGMQISEDRAVILKVIIFSELRTLFSVSIFQSFSFHHLADSCCTLLHENENQLLCFHARAHDFVDMWGMSRIPENLKCYFCFAPHRLDSAVHSTAVIVCASTRRVLTAEPIKEPQWS